MTAAPPIVLRLTRRIAFPAETVFDAWLDPELAREFLFATGEGEMIRAEIDPKVGGKFLFVDRRKEGDAAHYGVFVEIARPIRIVFSFSTEGYGIDATRVTVEIAPRGFACDLTLIHEMDPKWADYQDRAQKGWAMIIDNLVAALTRAAAS